MKLILLFISLLAVNTVTAQLRPLGNENTDSCYSDTLRVVTDPADWTIISNSRGAPNDVPATEVDFQYNSFPDYPEARWISCIPEWVVYTSTSDPDDSTTFRYKFNICKKDSVLIHLTVRRDNYCTVYLDGEILLKDEPVWETGYYDTGTVIEKRMELDICEHTIDVVDYNRHSYTGGNGFGMIVAGYIKSDNGSFLIENSACATAACCETSSLEDIRKKNVQVYPNPATDYVSVDIPGANGNVEYKIYDITGASRLTGKGKKIDISALTPGIYILRVEGYDKALRLVKR